MESKVICRNSVKLTEVRHNRLRDTISKEYNCDWSLISSKRRFTDLVEARRCYYSILRNIFFYTLEDIGKETSQDHSTVIAALKAHEKYITVYKAERRRYLKVKSVMLEAESNEELNERISSLKNEKKELESKIDELYLKVNRVQKELIINNK
jgi:chromosomal replication initiation ATPase DnaA